ncbi:hypothetical protein ABIC83_002502 [Roseateles asaccharophilus]|uniref:ADP-ribosyltransferase-containing protein n=1 Tax=Roseateles asaccharophilus TaxID=582607 RepID=UPI0038388B23
MNNPMQMHRVIAPNGRSIAENFSAWFGASKIVDAHGQPLVVCHGTLNDFTQFQRGHGEDASHGFMFAALSNVDGYLHSYLESVKYQDERHESRGDYFFMPVYLAIKNPKLIDTTKTGEWACPAAENREIKRAKAEGYDGLILVDQEQETTFYVAFRVEQMKSAIGNSGNYAPFSCSLVDSPRPPELTQAPRRRNTP